MLPHPDIKDLTKDELRAALGAFGLEPYRAVQIFEWVYRKGASSAAAMKNLPAGLREELARRFTFYSPKLLDTKRSGDGTIKYLLGLHDGHAIETVYLPARKRATVCVSSQVGCKHACAFCASAILGFARNLTPGEIVSEVLYAKGRAELPLTNIVFMGIGEPFDNYENVVKAIRILNDTDGLKIGARRITVSTCGLVPGIDRFAREGFQVELSVSLHAVDDETRSKIVPVNVRYPVAALMDACRRYIEATDRIITFEYVLMSGVNASVLDAEKLARLTRGIKCKVNLIIYNQIRALGYEAPSLEKAHAFARTLEGRGVTVTLRKSRGEDIDAGCGQLRMARSEGEKDLG